MSCPPPDVLLSNVLLQTKNLDCLQKIFFGGSKDMNFLAIIIKKKTNIQNVRIKEFHKRLPVKI